MIVRGNNIEVTDPLRDFVEKKLNRLEKYLDSPSAEATVVLSVIKDQHKVEVTIPYPGLLVRAEESSEDMYASIDLVIEKLERQVRKYKTKMNRKIRSEGSLRSQYIEGARGNSSTATAVAEEENEGLFEIVRTKKFNLMKPMDAEEAVLQMDMLGHNFFVFTNAMNDQINVIYKRKDGRYALIEAE